VSLNSRCMRVASVAPKNDTRRTIKAAVFECGRPSSGRREAGAPRRGFFAVEAACAPHSLKLFQCVPPSAARFRYCRGLFCFAVP